MKSIYELDMNVGMMILGIIFACNGSTMALVVLASCMVLTTVFFTNISMHQLMLTIKISLVYGIGIIILTTFVLPSIAIGLSISLISNCFTCFAWFYVSFKRHKLIHRLHQIALLMVSTMVIFEIAAMVLPVQGMLTYSPFIDHWMIRLTMMVLVAWMVVPLPLALLLRKHQRIMIKQDRLIQRMMER